MNVLIKTLLLTSVLFLTAAFVGRAEDSDKPPYIGEWSNGRGEVLIVTAKKLKFGEDKAVPFVSLPTVGDGSTFTLKITAKGEVNFFQKIIRITFPNPGEMLTQGYSTMEDAKSESGIHSETTWYRDK